MQHMLLHTSTTAAPPKSSCILHSGNYWPTRLPHIPVPTMPHSGALHAFCLWEHGLTPAQLVPQPCVHPASLLQGGLLHKRSPVAHIFAALAAARVGDVGEWWLLLVPTGYQNGYCFAACTSSLSCSGTVFTTACPPISSGTTYGQMPLSITLPHTDTYDESIVYPLIEND